jgi:hypothetical protein
MDNPYTSQYMPSGMPQQDAQGLNPVFQNINAQQQYLNQQLAQSNQLAQPQSQTTNYSGLNPLAMAAMLRTGNGDLTLPTSNISQVGGLNPSLTASNPIGNLAYSPTTYGTNSYGLGGFKY